MKISIPLAPASAPDPPRRFFAVKIGYPGSVSAWRAGAFLTDSSERRSIPPSGLRRRFPGAVSRRGWIGAGADPSNEIGAQPNRRLELAAPLVVELHL